jgi:cystathionine beta-synthase
VVEYPAPMRYHETILSAIGDTPLVKLRKLVPRNAATVLVKCEYMNPAGSIKDRMALHIIEKAEKAGILKSRRHDRREHLGQHGPGRRDGRGRQGLPLHLHDAGQDVLEKVNMLKAFGAEVVITPTNVPADSPQSYYETAKRIARETPGSVLPQPVRQPGQHRGPLPLDRPRDLEADRGPDRRASSRASARAAP